MKRIISLIIAIIAVLIAWLKGEEGTALLSYTKTEPEESVDAGCAPVLRWFKVSYFGKIPDPAHPGRWTRKWVVQKIKAYSAHDAAGRLGLRAGYNCFVIYLVGGG